VVVGAGGTEEDVGGRVGEVATVVVVEGRIVVAVVTDVIDVSVVVVVLDGGTSEVEVGRLVVGWWCQL